jgi:hypothetical protein
MEQLEMPHLLSADDPALFAVLLIRYWQTIAFLLVTCTSNSGGIPSDMKQILSFEPPPVGLLNRLLFNTFPANSTDRSSQQYCSPISLVFETIHQLERQRSESMRRLTGNGWPVKRLVECINAFSALLTLDFDAAVTTDSESLTDMAMIKSQNSNSAAVDWRYRAHKRLLDRLAGVQSPLAKLGVIDRLEHRVVQALRSPTAVYSGSSKDGNSSTFSSTQSTDRIIDSMQAIVGRYYPRGKGCRRLLFDVQLVVLLVPAPVLNMTAAGKAFWDLTVALMDLKRCFVDDCGDDDSSIYNL